jgi:hypothetical protein
MAHVLPESHFLDLPLELRQRIFGFVFPTQNASFWGPALPSNDPTSHDWCILNVLLCNKQIFNELHSMLDTRAVSFSACPESGNITSSILCLHGVNFSRVSSVRFELNPFQYTTSLPRLWLSLLLICKVLRKVPSISHLRIEIDGTLPRTKPPLYLNELDLDRGPLNIVLLLQPFNLLHNIRQVEIDILGGPLNDLWSENATLKDFASRLRKRMEAADVADTRHVVSVWQLRRQMRQHPSVLWFNDSYESTYAALVSDSTIMLPSDETPEIGNDKKL